MSLMFIIHILILYLFIITVTASSQIIDKLNCPNIYLFDPYVEIEINTCIFHHNPGYIELCRVTYYYVY